MTGTAVLFCGHGSRDPKAIREFELAAAGVRLRLPDYDFATGYLEFARPTIGDGLAYLARRGAKRILAIPGMLFAAGHVKNDLPREIGKFIAATPGIDVCLGRELGIDGKLLRAATERVAAGAADERIPRAETLLVVVGRGTGDPRITSNIAKIAGLLAEGLGLGRATVAFSGVAHPRVDAALVEAAGLGFRRIIVFPYFLFTGVLVKRIYAQTDAVAALYPEITFVKALYLRAHEAVLDAFCDRVAELGGGHNRAQHHHHDEHAA